MNRRTAFIERYTSDEEFAEKRREEWAKREVEKSGGMSNES